MDTDIISYETLLATQYSAEWVMYGAIAAWCAALGSIFTLICAASALNTWKKQEKTKIRSEFKRSLLALDYAIHMMPDDWNIQTAQYIHVAMAQKRLNLNVHAEYIATFSELKKCWHDALSAWTMCEGQLQKTDLTRLWGELSQIYLKFYSGRIDKLTILNKLGEMHSVKFIFD